MRKKLIRLLIHRNKRIYFPMKVERCTDAWLKDELLKIDSTNVKSLEHYDTDLIIITVHYHCSLSLSGSKNFEIDIFKGILVQRVATTLSTSMTYKMISTKQVIWNILETGRTLQTNNIPTVIEVMVNEKLK